MKRILLMLSLLASYMAMGQSTVKESLGFDSKILGKEVKYSIYLPDGYEQSLRTYPVLYLLHGYTYDETSWVQYGLIQELTDTTLEEEWLSQLIIVMPDAGTTWYQNDLAGKARYEDFFMEELIGFIESNYRAKSGKRFRALAGFSMGGWGALMLAMKHRDHFSSVAVINAAIYTDEQLAEGTLGQKRFDDIFGGLYGTGLVGYQRINDIYRGNAPLHLAADLSPEELKKIRYYIDCGDDDYLIPGNMEFHTLMRKREIPHEFRVRDGEHTWEYWRTAIPDVLRFINKDFLMG